MKKVLVIETIPKKQKLVRKYLTAIGADYDLINNQTSASYMLEYEKFEKYDLVILGMKYYTDSFEKEFSDSAGYKFLYHLAGHISDKYSKKVPIIIYSYGENWREGMKSFYYPSLLQYCYCADPEKEWSKDYKQIMELINSIDFVIGQATTEPELNELLSKWDKDFNK